MRTTTKTLDPTAVGEHLPLTPTVFEILLSLATEDRHGYAIMQEVESRSGGAVVLRPGSLYRAIHRLLDRGLVAELPATVGECEDARRRCYRLTELGREVASAETARYARTLAGPGAQALSDRSGRA